MSGFDLRKFARATTMERWPWAVRALLGCITAGSAVILMYSFSPLRAFPLLLAVPTVVLASWYLGMWGGVLCALTSALLIDRFLTIAQSRFSIGFVPEEVRLTVFLLVSILLCWAIRRLARQRSLLATRKLKRRLTVANAERQLAEERARASEALRERDDILQIALRTNGMGLWVWDSQQDIVQWSDEVYRIAGREPGSVEPSTETWLSFVHPEDIDAVRMSVMQARGDTQYHQQHRILWPDGTVRWVESQGTSHHDQEGRVTRIAGVLADITSRKLSEEAMLRTEKLAIAGRLAASVAHEINNPLEAVANLLYLITHAETAEEAHSQAELALEELMRISLITRQTLKFHRQAGIPEITALSEVVQNVLALFRGRLQATQIEVEVQADREERIACMPGEMQQIFANLVSNAIDAMPRGGRLVIRLQPSRDWGHAQARGMRVTFFDSGIGMDRATMQRMFEPFFTTKPDTGTGLGMWVVGQLVERHQGHISVWSSQNAASGTTAISIFFPSAGAPAPQTEALVTAQV
jgi:PAS domain S-box-containing protein